MVSWACTSCIATFEMRRDNATDGLVVIDKPGGVTSHDVVGQLRRLARTRRVGHAGTLDPMATGVLVLAVGRATRLLNHLDLGEKSYEARIRLGETSTTDDAEGQLTVSGFAADLTEGAVRAAMESFVGEIQQVPSAVSAIKVGGERAYTLVRAGANVELAAREVTVARFEASAFSPSSAVLDVDVIVECSAGTYVRALARDLGNLLGVGGHVTMLRRTRVGRFTLSDAMTVEQLATLADPVTLPMAQAVAATMPTRAITQAEVATLSFGQSLERAGIAGTYGAIAPDGTVAALLREDDARARSVVVFVAAG
jgi:tRNA pseudouridine55 synthase